MIFIKIITTTMKYLQLLTAILNPFEGITFYGKYFKLNETLQNKSSSNYNKYFKQFCLLFILITLKVIHFFYLYFASLTTQQQIFNFDLVTFLLTSDLNLPAGSVCLSVIYF